uniref:Zn(2)-C6 fungal-type domain-containing protein n=1 Tax=Spongospora subterranea TaxID=70186 RepID=A0A0H5RCL8_9EUKA|eukprot:CRZ12005.1 hypothetical protein [Spongospora subterranea]
MKMFIAIELRIAYSNSCPKVVVVINQSPAIRRVSDVDEDKQCPHAEILKNLLMLLLALFICTNITTPEIHGFGEDSWMKNNLSFQSGDHIAQVARQSSVREIQSLSRSESLPKVKRVHPNPGMEIDAYVKHLDFIISGDQWKAPYPMIVHLNPSDVFDDTLLFTVPEAEFPENPPAAEIVWTVHSPYQAHERKPIHPRYNTRIACVECHRSKLACDCRRPCARCEKAGKGALCKDRIHSRRKKKAQNQTMGKQPRSKKTF